MYKGLSLLIAIAFLLPGCSTIKRTWEPYGSYGNQCKVNPLKEVSLGQLDCIDALGKDDPGYTPDNEVRKRVAEARQKIETANQAAFEAELAKVHFTTRRLKDPVGGIVRAPATSTAEIVKAKIQLYCLENQLPDWDIIEVKAVDEYLGNTGGGSSYCTQYGCYGSNRSVAQYAYFNDVSFECKRGN